MATDVTLGGAGAGTLFVGEDKTLRLEVLDVADVPVDIAGWTIVFDVRNKDDAADPPILTKNASVTGVYNATRASNTQRAVVDVIDDDMNLFKGSNVASPHTYRHSWKRMDADQETVLCRGDFAPEKATAP